MFDVKIYLLQLPRISAGHDPAYWFCCQNSLSHSVLTPFTHRIVSKMGTTYCGIQFHETFEVSVVVFVVRCFFLSLSSFFDLFKPKSCNMQTWLNYYPALVLPLFTVFIMRIYLTFISSMLAYVCVCLYVYVCIWYSCFLFIFYEHLKSRRLRSYVFFPSNLFIRICQKLLIHTK